MDNEQWKSDGICSKCRRDKFCTKVCRAYKIHIGKIFQEAKTFEERVAILEKVELMSKKRK